ncbi:MAG TPA: proline dehydrogenase family protein [Ignavibacteria bacterium]
MNIINKAIVSILPVFPKKIVRIFANKYIAGDKIEDAVKKVKELNSKGIMATMDVLGEAIKNRDEAIKSKQESLEVLDVIEKHNLNSNLSVKLTMIGLNLDYDFCLSLITEIVEYANTKNNFVRIDMEDSSVTESTIKIFETLWKKYDNVGIVLQAYMRRSEQDILRLNAIGANFRICKGIYIEQEEIAFKKKQEVRDNFLKIIKLALEKKSYTGIATHDDYLVEGSKKIIKELGLKKEEFEFQMLLGVTENLRDKILNDGYRIRVYVPFGERWYQYSMRRFKENPNVVGAVMKSIFRINN